MRGAVLDAVGATPRIAWFPEPRPCDGAVVVEVLAAGLNPSDKLWADGSLGTKPVPRVVGNEGVGRVGQRRVYFERSVVPHGSFAPRALTRLADLIDVRDDVPDSVAVTLGISSLAAWVPLEHTARLERGESVLVLGASGPLGQAAVQAARLLGAGRVVAAARHEPSLARLLASGAADAAVVLDGEDDAAALRDAAGDGFDVVVDPLYGAPLVASLPATTETARVLQLGMSAAPTATIPWIDLLGRSILGYKNTTAPAAVKRRAFERMMAHAAAGDFTIETAVVALSDIAAAWSMVRSAPRKKIVLVPDGGADDLGDEGPPGQRS